MSARLVKILLVLMAVPLLAIPAAAHDDFSGGIFGSVFDNSGPGSFNSGRNNDFFLFDDRRNDNFFDGIFVFDNRPLFAFDNQPLFAFDGRRNDNFFNGFLLFDNRPFFDNQPFLVFDDRRGRGRGNDDFFLFDDDFFED